MVSQGHREFRVRRVQLARADHVVTPAPPDHQGRRGCGTAGSTLPPSRNRQVPSSRHARCWSQVWRCGCRSRLSAPTNGDSRSRRARGSSLKPQDVPEDEDPMRLEKDAYFVLKNVGRTPACTLSIDTEWAIKSPNGKLGTTACGPHHRRCDRSLHECRWRQR